MHQEIGGGFREQRLLCFEPVTFDVVASVQSRDPGEASDARNSGLDEAEFLTERLGMRQTRHSTNQVGSLDFRTATRLAAGG